MSEKEESKIHKDKFFFGGEEYGKNYDRIFRKKLTKIKKNEKK
jgi:hypothetical protein